MIYYIFHHWWAALIAGIVHGAVIIAILQNFHRPIVRLVRRTANKLFPSTTPSWKIIMNVRRGHERPRYFSLHTLATLMGRNDLLKIAKEMKRSCEVNAFFCNEVKAPVFFLDTVWDANEKKTWKMLKSFIASNPYPEIKGFKRATGSWSGGKYGVGIFTPPQHASPEPFISEDYAYANNIIKTLREHGRHVGISEYPIKAN